MDTETWLNDMDTETWLETLLPRSNDVRILERIATYPIDSIHTVFTNAVMRGNVEDAIVLLRDDPKCIYDRVYKRMNALHLAAYKHFDMVQFLMRYMISECLIDLLCETCFYGTALHIAVKWENLPIVRCIVETYPALLHVSFDRCCLPFELALRDNNLPLIDYFLAAIPSDLFKQTIQHSFHYVRDIRVAERLHRLDPTLVDNTRHGETPAYTVVAWSDNDVMLEFIGKLRPNQIDFELFYVAADKENKNALKQILILKPDLTGETTDDETVLHIIAQHIKTFFPLTNVLTHSFNDLTCVDKENKTPYDVAIENCNEHVTKAYEPFLTVEKILDSHFRFRNVVEERLIQQITTQCLTLNQLLLPELNLLVQSYVGHKHSQNKF